MISSMEIFHLPLLPQPERDKELFVSHTHEFDGVQRRIFLSTEYLHFREFLERLNPWSPDPQTIVKRFDVISDPVYVLDVGAPHKIVIKRLNTTNYPSQRRVDYLKTLLGLNPYRDLNEEYSDTKKRPTENEYKKLQQTGPLEMSLEYL